MNQPNPLLPSTSPGAELPAGTYIFKLMEIQQATQPEKKCQNINGKKVFTPTGKEVPCLIFRFMTMHKTHGEARTRAVVAPYTGPKSGFVKLLKAMVPGAVTEEIRGDLGSLWNFALSQVGKKFLIAVEPSNGYNNYKNIMPAPVAEPANVSIPPSKPVASAPVAAQDGVVDLSGGEDDIPW
jgi:hypothetical protein